MIVDQTSSGGSMNLNQQLPSIESEKSLSSILSSKLSTGSLSDGLNGVARFILYSAANAFLKQDYEYCLKICSKDYSFEANMNVFEGNIVRLKALALEHSIQSQRFSNNRRKTYGKVSAPTNEEKETLLQAIEAVKNSLEIFEGEHSRSMPTSLRK